MGTFKHACCEHSKTVYVSFFLISTNRANITCFDLNLVQPDSEIVFFLFSLQLAVAWLTNLMVYVVLLLLAALVKTAHMYASITICILARARKSASSACVLPLFMPCFDVNVIVSHPHQDCWSITQSTRLIFCLLWLHARWNVEKLTLLKKCCSSHRGDVRRVKCNVHSWIQTGVIFLFITPFSSRGEKDIR